MMVLKYFYLVMGVIFLIIGILGVFLPLLPTTPFLILAGFFFSKSSEKFHSWLMNHEYLGPPIHDWKNSGVIRKKYKIFATLMMMISVLFIVSRNKIPMIGKGSFMLVIMGVLIFIWSRPSTPEN